MKFTIKNKGDKIAFAAAVGTFSMPIGIGYGFAKIFKKIADKETKYERKLGGLPKVLMIGIAAPVAATVGCIPYGIYSSYKKAYEISDHCEITIKPSTKRMHPNDDNYQRLDQVSASKTQTPEEKLPRSSQKYRVPDSQEDRCSGRMPNLTGVENYGSQNTKDPIKEKINTSNGKKARQKGI